MPIQILTIESQPFAENSYLVWKDGATEAFVIDPGFEPDLIREALADHGLTLAAIVCTHGHVDHTGGSGALARDTGAAVYVHPDDDFLTLHPVEQVRAMFGITRPGRSCGGGSPRFSPQPAMSSP